MAKRVKPTGSVRDAAFAYISVCCKEVAEKPAVPMPKGKGIGNYVGAKPEGDATLGKWRCSKCRRKCKVIRQSKSTVVPVQESIASAKGSSSRGNSQYSSNLSLLSTDRTI